jgi:hypothetical protein
MGGLYAVILLDGDCASDGSAELNSAKANALNIMIGVLILRFVSD